MNLRDTAERLFWTLVAAFLGALTVSDLLDISALQAAIAAAASAGANFLLLVARARLSVLPEPGEGLPGLPVEQPVNIADRLRELGLHDDEPTTPERGAVDLVGALLLIAAVIVILAGLKFLGVDFSCP